MFTSLASALDAEPNTVKDLTIDARRPEMAWKTCPDGLWSLTALEVLSLIGHDGLAILPRITELGALRSLRLVGGRYRLPSELGRMSSLRELHLSGFEMDPLPEMLGQLRLDRLYIAHRNWAESIDVLASIPVTTNVTLLDGHPDDTEALERKDLSAWSSLQELEIDAFDDFEPTVFARKLPRCGFAINKKRHVDYDL